AGSYDAWGVHAATSQRWNAASFRLAAEDRASENYREHNALQYKSVVARAAYETATARIGVDGSYVFEDLETPGPLFAAEVAQDRRQSTANFRNDFSDTNSGFVHVSWRQVLDPAWTLDTDFTHRRSFGDFLLSF